MRLLALTLSLASAIAVVPALVWAQQPEAARPARLLDIFKEVRQRHLTDCMGHRVQACIDLQAGYERALEAPDVTNQNRHDMLMYMTQAMTWQGAGLRESGQAQEARQVLSSALSVVHKHFDGGRHFHTYIDNHRLFKELTVTLLQLGRVAEADAVVATARRSFDSYYDARDKLQGEGARRLLRDGLVYAEELEQALSAVYASKYFPGRRGAASYNFELARSDLTERLLESRRRSEKWLFAKDQQGVKNALDLNPYLRYAEIKLDIGNVLLDQGRKPEAEQEYLAAYNACSHLMGKGRGETDPEIDKSNAHVAKPYCERAALGWAMATGEYERRFDAAFDRWYEREVKRMDDGGQAAPFVRR